MCVYVVTLGEMMQNECVYRKTTVETTTMPATGIATSITTNKMGTIVSSVKKNRDRERKN